MTLLHETKIETKPPKMGSVPSGFQNQLDFDRDSYLKQLEGEGLNEKQRQEFLAALWSVVLAFTDLGYRIHPVQCALPNLTSEGELNQEVIRTVEELWLEAA